MNSSINSINQLYAFQSITQLTVGNAPLQGELRPRTSWMLIGIAGTGIVRLNSEPAIAQPLTPGGALMGDAASGAAGLELQPQTEEGEWKLYFVEFAAMRLTDDAAASRSEQPADDGAVGKAVGRPGGSVACAAQAGELAALAERLYFTAYMLSHEEPLRSLTAHMLVQQMMLWWHREGGARSDTRRQRTTEQAVLDVAYYMEEHYTEALTRERLAALAGVADAYFSMLFKKLTGVQPSVYLERLRVHRAAELLLQDRGRKGDLADIAQLAGFRDSWYMSRRFRGAMGMGPSLFRTQFVPERVASLQYPYTHHLLALGVAPAAARFSHSSNTVPAAARRETAEFPALLSIEGQKQLLSASRAQLILTYDTEDIHARWRGMAPVIYIPWLGMDWREHLRTIGRLLKKEGAAAACIDRLDGRAEQARAQVYGRFGPDTTVSIFKIEHKRCYLYGVRDAGCIFYELLGFRPPAMIANRLAKEPNLHSIEITMQQMTDCAGDINVIILASDIDSQIHFLQTNEHWRAFEIAASRRLLYLDYREWLHYDPIHLEAQLRRISDILLDRQLLG